MKKRRTVFVLLNAGLLLLLPLSILYIYLSRHLEGPFFGCLMHDLLLLYCPVCGGTRAIEALLSLDLLGALSYNAAVTLTVLGVLALDVVSWVRFFQKKDPFFPLPRTVWILFAILVGLFFILRNLLMILFGFDPTGDLGALWRLITK